MGEIAEVTMSMVPATTAVLTPLEVQNQVDTMREMQRSVLTSGVDYGIVPDTDRPTLLKPGAELLLKAHGFGHRLAPVEVERDKDGHPFGVTYRCTVFKPLPSGVEITVATCDGYAGYDEARYYQSQASLEARERANAEKYRRSPNPLKWAKSYRAPWNTVVKISEKRALVGAALQATATSGLFTQDVEDYPGAPAMSEMPWWAELGFHDEEAAKQANDALRAKLEKIPKDGRAPLREWAQAHGYGALLPVAAKHIEEYGELLARLADAPATSPPGTPSEAVSVMNMDAAAMVAEVNGAVPALVAAAALKRVYAMNTTEVDAGLAEHSLVPKGDSAARRWTLAKELVLDAIAIEPDELPLDDEEPAKEGP